MYIKKIIGSINQISDPDISSTMAHRKKKDGLNDNGNI